jgi:hypothetical protein
MIQQIVKLECFDNGAPVSPVESVLGNAHLVLLKMDQSDLLVVVMMS